MKICVNQFDVYPKVAFAGTRGSYGVDATLEFEFGESWTGLAKSVSFYPADGSAAVSVVLGSSECIKIPYEVMRSAGQAQYVISGTEAENVIISVTGSLQVVTTLDPTSTVAIKPTPSVTDQLIEYVNEATERVDECIGLMENCKTDIDAVSECAKIARSAADEATAACETVMNTADEFSESEAERVKNEEARVSAEKERESEFERFLLATEAIGVKGRTVGESGVRIDDISPIEHTLEVKCRSKNILDVNTATLWTNASGVNNNFALDSERTATGLKLTFAQDAANSWLNGGYTVGLVKDFLGKTLTLSVGNVLFSYSDGTDKPTFGIAMCKHDYYYMGGSNNLMGLGNVTEKTSVTLTVPEDADYETYPYLRVMFYGSYGGTRSAGDYAVYEDIMVEVGDTATEYREWQDVSKYHVDVYGIDETGEHIGYQASHINDDGTVDGLTSIYPEMIIESIVVDGIIVEVTYNRDASKVISSLEERIAALEAAIVS